jgi:hypothetical protein
LTSEVSSIDKPPIDYRTPSKIGVLETRDKNKKKDSDELKIINGSLKTCTSKVRNKMFSTLDPVNVKIINSLKSFEGFLCFEDHRRDIR